MQPYSQQRYGGAGNKVIALLDDQVDAIVHVVKSMKYWDTCAAEALLRARYAHCSNKNGDPIMYEHQRGDYTIRKGLIYTENKAIYDLIDERAGDFLKDLIVERGKMIVE